MRRRLIPLGALALLPATLAALARTAPGGPVVLLSIDGLRPDYVLEADRYGLLIPELRRVLAEGAHARAMTGVLPTVTYPSHTTLVTGVSPARHGILGNRTFDPLGRNREGWYWYAEDIRVPTLWDAARKAGLATSSVDWPVTVGARIDHNIVQYWRTDVPDSPDDAKLSRVLSTPGLLAAAEGALGPYPSGYAYSVAADRRRAAFSAWMLEAKRPRLHLAYLSGLDEEQHVSGPGSRGALQALEAIDALVGELRRAAERAGDGRGTLAIVSDHGHSRTVRELRLNEALRAAGLFLLDGRGRVSDWRAVAWGSGGSAAIMLRNTHDAEARRRVSEILDRLRALPDSPIAEVLDAAAARAAGGHPEAAFVVAAKPDVRITERLEAPVVGPALPEGSHGFLPDASDMAAALFLVGPGIPAGTDLGVVDMRDVAPTLARRLGLSLATAEGRDLLAHTGS
jgi:hypothetical protein